MTIRVIGFDLDDTLWAVKPVIIRAEQVLGAFLSEAAPQLENNIETMRNHREAVVEEDPAVAHQLTELRRRVIERALLESKLSERDASDLSAQAIEVFLKARNEIEFFDGVTDALSHLSGIFTLGALSNGNADINRIGLDRYFSFAFSAEDVGAPKPHPNLFEAALAHNNIDPHEMVYVGDDPVLDVDAAGRMGMRTVWMENESKAGTGETEPDAVIRSLRELPAAIESLNR